MKVAKISYLQTKIGTTSKKGKEIFSIVKSFTAPKAISKEAPLSADWTNQVACSFHEKIVTIYQSFSVETREDRPSPGIEDETIRPHPSLGLSQGPTLLYFPAIEIENSLTYLMGLMSGLPADACPAKLLPALASTSQ